MPQFLLFIQGLVLFSALLTAFSARRIFGLAPLFLVLGLAEGFKYFVATRVNVDVALLGSVNVGSAVYFTASLAIILVVFLREGVAAVQPIAWGLMFLSMVSALLTLLIFESSVPMAANADTARVVTEHSLTAQLVGSALLFIDIIVLLLVFNALRAKRLNLGFALVFSMLLVVSLDTLAYDAIVRASEFSGWTVLTGVAAKSAFVGIYAVLTLIYLRLFERNSPLDLSSLGGSVDLFSLLTYQDKLGLLEQQLHEDALTGAFNRRFLDSWLPEQLALDQRRGLSTALLILDLDNFKVINDQNGHLVGDIALMHAVDRTRSQLRRGDTLCRYGGEEFVVVLNSSNWPEALNVAERIRAELAASPLFLSEPNQPLTLTASIGVALSPDDAHSARELIRAADARLFTAKRTGRNRVEGVRPKLVVAS